MLKHQNFSSMEAKEKIHEKNLYNSGGKSLREIQIWSKSTETPILSCPIPERISGANEFRPEIHLSNRIIMDLSWKHRNELVPVNLQRSKKLAKRFEIESCVDEEPEEVNEPGIGKMADEEKPRKGKSVTFLDEKLREGFTNVAFVLSPSSGNESQTQEGSTGGGIDNAGYAASPVETCGRSCTSGRRPKPIISASEEFLESLNRVYSPEKPEGISNEGFILSPSDAAGRNFAESETAAESKIPPEKKKKKGFVDQIRIISHRKSASEKENFPKGKTWKTRHGGLLKRRNSDKVGKSLAVPESETFTSAGSPKYTQSVAIDKTDSPKSDHFQMENRENPFDRHLQWKFASMSKLPIRGLVNDAAECSGEKENHFYDDLNQEEEEGGRMDFWVEGFRMNNRKKVDKINKINIHLHALFSAVENGHVDKARTILESSDVDVNSINGDGFTPLDVAILTNHRSLAKMLLAFGAQQSNHFQSPDKLDNHLKSLLIEAEKRVQDLSGSGGSMTSGDSGLSSGLNNNRGSFSVVGQYPSSSSISGHGGTGDSDKELFIRERRVKGLRKMLLGFDQTRPPDLPFLVTVEVTGTSSVTVRFQAPEQQDSSICTKYKVQWSESENFDLIAGEKEITDPKCQECFIGDLEKGKRYWFRVACGNLKGFGNFKVSTPTNVVPSSWRDGQGKEPRFSGTLHQLEELFEEVRNLRPETASEIKDFSDQEKQGDSTAAGRRAPKKKTIKQLFTVAGKFQKHLKRGVYLVCLFYHDDKILVTNEDFLPAIEVDETYPSSINNDLHWFMKVACTWSDVKSLKQDMEKNLTSTTSHFRIKLLQAAQQMQSNLSTQDLGQLYYKPIRDAQGTLAFCAVNCFVNLKSVSVLNLRWTPISKIQKKMVASEESNVGELLMASIQSQIAYHRVSNLKLSKGLYLGYLKMKSSVDLIQIIVPTKTPNVLPHYKIRNNPHVSSEEWEWLKRINSRHKSLENLQSQTKDVREADFLKGTEQQQMFVEQVASTARKLFSHLDVSLDDAMLHRLYDVEVVDLNSDVTFLIIVPPVETSCSVPGQKDILLERGDLMSISLQVFEMVHLGTYQPDVISRYSRLSCILELDLILAQHSHREAFSSSEVVAAKDRLTRLQELQIQLNGVWKSVRWIMDLITFARDRNSSSGSLQLSHPKPSGNLSGKMSAIQTTSLSTGISSCGVNSVSGVPMKHLLALTKKKESSKKSPNRVSKSKCTKENHHFVKCEKRCLLQIPDSPKDPKISKSNVSRGSWPGLGLDNSGSLLDSSFSKSEQHLNVLGGGNGGDGTDDGFRKFSDCSSDYVTGGEARTIDSCDPFVKPGRKMSSRDPMSSFENRMLFSRSEDYLFMGHDMGSLKQSIGYQGLNRSRMNPTTMTTTSVSATNSPLLPQRNLCESTLNRNNGGSSLSVANTNTSGSLHSVSSDESTAAVVSLPVTTPYRSNAFPTPSVPPVQHSASLMSLAKPIIPPNGGGHVKPKIPVTLSLNSLTEISNGKRVGGGIVGGSILSGNIIPVDINQKPQKTSGNLLDAAMLNPHISSSLPSFSKYTSTGPSNLLTNVPLPGSGHGNQRIRSPVKSPIKAVSPTDTVLSRVSGVLRSSASVQPSQYLPFETDHRPHVDLTVDGSFATTGHKKLSSGDINAESTITSGFSSSGTTGSRDSKLEDETEDLENGVKVPALSSGVLQVYAAYETGLASGTSLKLHVTPRTSAREVVDLVVKQLNMAVLLKGKDGPIYTADKLKNFCLVAVIGARERCLRDDFKPLQLQNPWKKGRLYVRQKQDVLAAIEYSSRQTAFL